MNAEEELVRVRKALERISESLVAIKVLLWTAAIYFALWLLEHYHVWGTLWKT